MSDSYITERLRDVVDPYGQHPMEDVETLLWRVGRMRDEIEHAHSWLDMRPAAKREAADGGRLTLLGRLDTLKVLP